jgi:hypothetical protein
VLGYNPLKQIAQPRPVGWISTYGSGGGGDGGGNRVAHIAPYSFFGDVARGDRPTVAYAHVYLRRHLCCSIVATFLHLNRDWSPRFSMLRDETAGFEPKRLEI